jgi:acyl carrier protein
MNKIFPVDSLEYEKTMALAAARVIPKEIMGLRFQCIDYSSKEFAVSGKEIAREVLAISHLYSSKERLSFRKGVTWQPGYEKLNSSQSTLLSTSGNFQKGGTYLISGCNGAIAKALGLYLYNNYEANLILIGRSDPERSYMESLNQGKSKVKFIKSDIIDKEILEQELQLCMEAFGTSLSGVFHTAGVADFGGLIIDRADEDCKGVLKAKVNGTSTLFEIIQSYKPDFYMLCSSNSSLIAPLGQIAYVAANQYQNAFAIGKVTDIPIISILWDSWSDAGMAVEARKRNSINTDIKDYFERNGISTAEGLRIFEYAAAVKLKNIIVSTRDFDKWLLAAKEMNVDAISKFMDKQLIGVVEEKQRPNLKNVYTPPTSSTQADLCGIWKDFFRYSEIGIDDNFFELGGDSLKAMTMMNRTKKKFNVHLSLKELFQNPTIRFLAENIDTIKAIEQAKTNNNTTLREIRI